MIIATSLRSQTFCTWRAWRAVHSTAVRLESKLNEVPIDRTRNIGIIAHIDAGKTTTTERMLYYSGKTKRIGNVDEGDTVTDYLPSERQRGITIQLAAISIPWNNHKINIIDTPGHADFTFEVTRSLRVLDGAVTILDGVAGVEAQTEKVWKQATSLNIPKIAYVNKMDRPGAGFSRTVMEIIEKLQTRVVLCNVPYFENSKDNDPVFCGVADILHVKLLKWNPEIDPHGKNITVIDIEAERDTYPEVYETVVKSRESMVETLGEFDEAIIDSFLESNEDYMNIPINVLNEAIRKATLENYLTPVYCGSSFRNIGVQPLMDGVVKYLPSPLQILVPEITSSATKNVKIKHVKAKQAVKQDMEVTTKMNNRTGLVVNANPNLTLALAFKVMTHATRGVMTFFRVYSGKLVSNSIITNTTTGKKLHVKKLFMMHGDEPEEVKHISSGNIGVITGHEDDIQTGDTLVSHSHLKKGFSEMESNLKLLPIEIPPPLFNSAIEPQTAGDEAYMKECVRILTREDPSLKVSVDEEMGQTIISGMGELHLDIVKERLVRDMKAKVTLRDVAVSYKETLLNPGSSYKQTSESGSVSIEIEMDSFEGAAEESSFFEENGAMIIAEDNNIIIIEPLAILQNMLKALEERRWKSTYSLEDLQEIVIQGCLTALQMGGPIFGLSLHSTVIRVKSWDFPVADSSVASTVLLDVSRSAVTSYIATNRDWFGILEPIMETRVYIDSDIMGEVSHDLTQRCQAVIKSIEDESTQDVDALAWAKDEAEKTFLPPDYTMKAGKDAISYKNKKIIIAETPLREMIGYLSRLRSITQGRGTFDMTYIGMRRAIKSRFDAISKEFNFM